MGQDRPISLTPGGGRRSLRTLIKAAISLCVLWIVLSLVDTDDVLDGLRRLGLSSFLLYLLGFLFLHALSALKWRFFLKLSDVPLRIGDALTCHAGALFGNLCLPGLIGGDLFRLVMASRKTGQSEAVLLGSIADRLADLTALLLLVLTGFVLALGTSEFDELLPGSALTACCVVVVSIGLGLTLGVWLLRMRSLRSYPRSITRRLIGFIRAYRAFRNRSGLALCGLGLCFLLQLGFVGLNIALGRVVGLDMDPRLWFFLWPLAKIIAMAPVSFGGIGVREAAFAVLVAPFAAKELAVAQSLVWECVLITGGLLCGLSLIVTRVREKQPHG